MKTFFKFGLGMATFLLAGCSSNNLDEIAPKEESSFPEYNVTMTIPEIGPGEGETRTTLTYQSGLKMKFAWAEGDVVGVYSDEASGGNLATFKIKNISASDPSSANFNGGGFRLIGGNSYTAFCPYNGTAIEQTAVPVDYNGQIQVANDNTDHLGPFDYMAAKAVASGDNVANFSFSHLSTFLRIRLNVPQAGTYTSLKISAPVKAFILKGQVNLLADTPSITCEDESNISKEFTVLLGTDGSGINLASDNMSLIIFVSLPPVDLSGKTLTFTLTESNGRVTEFTKEGLNMAAQTVNGYVPTVVSGSVTGSGSGYPFG